MRLKQQIKQAKNRFEPEIMKLPVSKFEKGSVMPANSREADSLPLILKGSIDVTKVDN